MQSSEPTGTESAEKAAASRRSQATGSSAQKVGEDCIQPDGTFKFQYDPVLHAHNYEEIRGIPTGGYL